VPRAARTDTRVDLVLAGVCGVAALVCLILPAPMRNATAAALRGTVVAPLAALQERAELGRKAFLARDEALRVADSVTLRSQRLAGVEEENERLRRLLGLAAAVQWGFVPAEVLQGRGLGDEFTATLSAGRREGVEAFSPVIAPEGLDARSLRDFTHGDPARSASWELAYRDCSAPHPAASRGMSLA